MKKLIINEEKFEVLFNKKAVQKQVAHIAEQIADDKRNNSQPPILLMVLTGGLYFGVDLSRELDKRGFVHHVDTVSLKSYSGEQGGEVRLASEPHASLKGRDIIVVEDIIDRGDSMNFLNGYLVALKPASIRFGAFLVKQNHGPLRFTIDYFGFMIGEGWLGGYGY